MELKIKDRDYVADGAGGLVRVSGWDELLERVLFKLSVRRGSFALVPELGSKLHLLWREKGESRATAAKQYAAEALADEEGLSVTGIVTETIAAPKFESFTSAPLSLRIV